MCSQPFSGARTNTILDQAQSAALEAIRDLSIDMAGTHPSIPIDVDGDETDQDGVDVIEVDSDEETNASSDDDGQDVGSNEVAEGP